MNKYLNIGIVSNRVNLKKVDANNLPKIAPMDRTEEIIAKREIREGLIQLMRGKEKPEIIIVPELSTPRGFVREMKRYACKMNSIIVFGVDYLIDNVNKTVKNQIIVTIPDRWPKRNYNRKTFSLSIDKRCFPLEEKVELGKKQLVPRTDKRLWIIDAGPYGNIGIANCYDFLDVEMHLLYRNKIQHLFVLSYNMDKSSFIHTAESLCRTIFCNVIICNTGYFGGSVSIAPYDESYERVIYSTEGKNLFTTQVIKIPVKDLKERQDNPDKDKGQFPHHVPGFKNLPPGF